MSKPPLVSIIVPCYNYAHLLPETLDSVLAQTMPDWECIIVNDGSKDNTHQVAQDYVQKDARFRYIEQENKGLSAARNVAIKEAKGAYIQLLDADDILFPTKLSQHIAVLEANPDVDLVYSLPHFFYTNTPNDLLLTPPNVPYSWWLRESGTGQKILDKLIENNRFIVCTPLFKKGLTAYKFDETLKSHEDWDFWLACCQNNAYFHYSASEMPVIKYRMHPSSMSGNVEKMKQTAIAVRKKITKTPLSSIQAQTNQNALQTDYILLGIYYKKNNQFWEGQKQVLKGISFEASLKRSIFAVVCLFLSGKTSEKLLKKITGQ